MLTMLFKCDCDRTLSCRGFFNTGASFIKVIKKTLSCTKNNNSCEALEYLLGAYLPAAGAFSFPSWRLRVEVSSQLLSTIVLQKNNNVLMIFKFVHADYNFKFLLIRYRCFGNW